MLFLVRPNIAATWVRPFHWTREEYYRLAELGLFHERRVQLIDGEIIEMSPPGSQHSSTIDLVRDALKSCFGTGFLIRTEQPLHVARDAVPQPDAAVVRGGPRDYVQEHPATALLVVEISDSSLRLDSGRKAALYARAGIEEYWIVNLADDRLDVYRKPIFNPKLEFGAGYSESRSLMRGDRISPLAAPQSVVEVHDLLP